MARLLMPERFMRRNSTMPLALITFAAFATIQCASSSSPTSPADAPTLSSVTSSASTVAVGASAQGTVSLAAAAPTGTIVALASSNPAVLAVQTPVAIPTGSSSVSFTITGVAAGTATITASANGTSRQSPTIRVGPTVALSAISLSAPSVIGGNRLDGTVRLTGAAPADGAVVTLSA